MVLNSLVPWVSGVYQSEKWIPYSSYKIARGSCEARLGAKGIYCVWEIGNSKELHCDVLDAKLCAQGSR